MPKVIDFGLAKALGHKLTDKTLYTALDTRVGTLEYSAPEQAAGRSFDVDTRSDIYSLGVLYELLTGAPPFTQEELKDRRGGNAPRDPRGRADQAEQEAVEFGRSCPRSPPIGHGAEQADAAGAGRSRLDRDEVWRRNAPSLRDGQRLRDARTSTWPTSRCSAAVGRQYRLRRRPAAGVRGVDLGVPGLVAGVVGTTYGLILGRNSIASSSRINATSWPSATGAASSP